MRTAALLLLCLCGCGQKPEPNAPMVGKDAWHGTLVSKYRVATNGSSGPLFMTNDALWPDKEISRERFQAMLNATAKFNQYILESNRWWRAHGQHQPPAMSK